MKRIISLCLIFTSILFGAVSTSTIKAISSSANSINSSSISDTKSEEEASKEVTNYIQSQDINNVKVEEFESQESKSPLNDLNKEFDDKSLSIYSKYFSEVMKKNKQTKLFGIDIINNAKDTLMPESIGKNYVLGSGDMINVKIWSEVYTDNQNTSQVIPLEINKQGTIFIPNVGSFSVTGKSIATLQSEIIVEGKKKLKYFNAEINLEKIREISIFVLGEVNKPGQILTTPYTNILNLLNKAQGITDKASLRKIKIIRGNQEINIDLYAYLLGNKNVDDLKLKDGDTLVVPVVKDLVVIEGAVNREGIYEFNNEPDYKSLITIAGGYSKLADKSVLQAYFINNGTIEIINVESQDKVKSEITKLNVNRIDEKNKNEVYILGAVVNTGEYSFTKGLTFSDLLKKAGGFVRESSENYITIIRGRENKIVLNFNPKNENPVLELGDEVYIYNYNDINNRAYASIQGAVSNAGSFEIYDGSRVLNLLYSARGLDEKANPYMNRADIFRIDENGRLKVFKIDLNKLLKGNQQENILLRRNDMVKIYTYDEIVKFDDIYIYGEVREQGKYTYYENMSLEDLIFYAKGLQNKADNNITIVRNDNATKQVIEMNIDIERNPDFKLIEGDIIFVRKKADWLESKLVKLDGFVKYPGTYTLNHGETLTTLITRAGGFSDGAFPEGLQLTRRLPTQKINTSLVDIKSLNNETTSNSTIASGTVKTNDSTTGLLALGSKNLNDSSQNISENVSGSEIVYETQKVSNFEYNPNSKIFTRDVELKDGDAVYIPEKPTTVKVQGEVYSPSYVIYDNSMRNYEDYIKASGGYKETAYKKKTYVIKANGKIITEPKKAKIEPGDTVYVPEDTRSKKGFERAMDAFKGTLEIISTVALIIVLF